MGTIVCQTCDVIIEHFETEKCVILYGKCCEECKEETEEYAS